MKKVLVTGGAGFIGSNLCKRLIDDGEKVVCLDNLSSGNKTKTSFAFQRGNFEFVDHDICYSYHYEDID